MLRLALLFCWVLTAKDYSLCTLGDGPRSGTFAPKTAQEIQAKHMQHIKAMWDAGVLESAGPTAKWEGVRGLFVFSTPLKTARVWAAKDPKVIERDLTVECFVWKTAEGVGKDYRARFGKPGFAEKFAGHPALLSVEAPAGKTLAAGKIAHPRWKYFSVLAEPALEAKSGQMAFTWYHDAQVWP